VFGCTEVVKIRARDPPTKQGITQQATGELKGLIGSNGTCTLSGNLPSDVCYQNQMANVVIHINNGQCKKMVKKTQLKVHRTIIARAIDINGQRKEWNDKQVVMAGEFDSVVAKQEPNLAIQQFNIELRKVKGVDVEKNRYIMKKSFEDGRDINKTCMELQSEVLPSVDTNLIKVSYEIECRIAHETMMGWEYDMKEGITFPMIVARDPQGPFDQGTDGMVAA